MEQVKTEGFSTTVCRGGGALRAGLEKMARWKQGWTESELERLRSLAGTVPITQIAKELGRTTGTVLAKATEEKLSIIVHTRSGRA
ncbi:hypothetical protein RAD16_38660 [Bradyrhizobium sp. 18BD]